MAACVWVAGSVSSALPASSGGFVGMCAAVGPATTPDVRSSGLLPGLPPGEGEVFAARPVLATRLAFCSLAPSPGPGSSGRGFCGEKVSDFRRFSPAAASFSGPCATSARAGCLLLLFFKSDDPWKKKQQARLANNKKAAIPLIHQNTIRRRRLRSSIPFICSHAAGLYRMLYPSAPFRNSLSSSCFESSGITCIQVFLDHFPKFASGLGQIGFGRPYADPQGFGDFFVLESINNVHIEGRPVGRSK